MPMKITVHGHFFDGTNSKKLPASLTIFATGRILLSGRGVSAPTIEANFQDISITPRLGNTPRILRFPGNQLFETPDNDSIDRALHQFNQAGFSHFVHRLESHWLMVLIAATVVITMVVGGAKYGVPWMAKVATDRLPQETEQYLGQGALDMLESNYLRASELDQQRQQELQTKFNHYGQQFPQLRLRFLFRHAKGIGPNAFALPNGTIIFTDELVKLAHHDEELIAILGHEIGHVVHHHSLRRILQNSLMTALIVLMTGDVSAASSIVLAMPSLLLELAYSREFETEADDFAYDFLTANEISPQHFANIMQRLEQNAPEPKQSEETPENTSANDENGITDSIAGFLSTHPITQERIEKFQVTEARDTK